jgi:hypothetical protein
MPPMNPKPQHRSPRIALLACAAALLTSGCGSVNELRVDDNSAPIASLRLQHRLGEGNGRIELEYGRVRASSTQQLPAFRTVRLANNRIEGPASVRNTAQVQHGQVVYNHLLFKDRPVEMEWFAGVAAVNLRWTARSDNPADPLLQRGETWYGVAGGVLGRLNLGSGLALEGRYSAAAQPRVVGDGRTSVELALAFSPSPALQLRAGVADTRLDREDTARDLDSRLSLRARGPFLGSVVAF